MNWSFTKFKFGTFVTFPAKQKLKVFWKSENEHFFSTSTHMYLLLPKFKQRVLTPSVNSVLLAHRENMLLWYSLPWSAPFFWSALRRRLGTLCTLSGYFALSETCTTGGSNKKIPFHKQDFFLPIPYWILDNQQYVFQSLFIRELKGMLQISKIFRFAKDIPKNMGSSCRWLRCNPLNYFSLKNKKLIIKVKNKLNLILFENWVSA